MIRIVVGELGAQTADGVLRPVRTDLAPVNAASRDVLRAAGRDLVERLERMGPLPIGGAVLTPAGTHGAGYLIHVVVMSEEEPQTSMSIQRALRNGLRRASDWGLESLALPALGMGAGALDLEASARVLVELLLNHVDEGELPRDLTVVVASEFESQLLHRLVDEMSRQRSSIRN